MTILFAYALCLFGAATNAGMYGYHVTGNILDGFHAAAIVLCSVAALSLLIVSKPWP